MHTLETAAAAVGRNKNAILRANKTGKIPVAQTETGEMQIDSAHLHRQLIENKGCKIGRDIILNDFPGIGTCRFRS